MSARERWNRRWTEREPLAFGRPPAEWLVENRSLLLSAPGRRALDVACGDGRNAAYLAQLGFGVDALDVSGVVIEALIAAAADRGLAVTARQVDLENEALPAADYDAIVQVNYLQRDLFGALEQALAPGGILIIETFVRTSDPRFELRLDPRYLLEPDELPTAFPRLEVLRHREGVRDHRGNPRWFASLVARRPSSRGDAADSIGSDDG